MELKTTAEIRDIYDNMSSWWRWSSIYDTVTGMNRLRSRQFRDVSGHVLDVACGTGENFKYLSKAESITAIDLAPGMVDQARKRAERMGIDVLVEVADVNTLPFDDDAFDTVVSAYSSCTFTDYLTAYQEMERVTRPGGQILMVEHGRSSVAWIAQRQEKRFEAHYERSGCRNTREPIDELREAGLNVMSAQKSHMGMGNRLRIRVR